MPYKDIEKRKEWHENDRQNNPEKVKLQIKKATLKMKYGISVEKYNEILHKQNGVCAICFRCDNRNLSVDHSHETERVRGLLCRKCNLAIGNMEENINFLKSAINYLRKYND